ncbi:MAG: acyl-CoA dehydratase activase-related protein [Bacillota bacterium]|nr:acyl-CoA dehydratase activase-related protein [Bacillota bacterium]
MKIGVPQGLMFFRYEAFVREFLGNLGADVCYSGPSSGETLERGTASCVSEACLPVKLFCGHAAILTETGCRLAVPRVLRCEYGLSLCPKLAGLPELVKNGVPSSAAGEQPSENSGPFLFSRPLDLRDPKKLERQLSMEAGDIGVPVKRLREAFRAGLSAQARDRSRQIREHQYRRRVFLAGHPYNVHDPFANLDLLNRLHRLDIGVIAGEAVPWHEKMLLCRSLMKQPYWSSFVENYGAALHLARERAADGIIYLSSFCCGTDSFTVDMIQSRMPQLPMLVLKLDGHTGEAGLETRLQAFADVLERRGRLAYLSPLR